MSECYQLTFTLNSGLFLSLLGNWQADQFRCIIHTPTVRGVIMVKIVRIIIEFLWYMFELRVTIKYKITLLHQNCLVLNLGCWLIQLDVYNGC